MRFTLLIIKDVIVKIEGAQPVLGLEVPGGFLHLFFQVSWFENCFKFLPEAAVRTKWEFIYINVPPTWYFFLQDGREVVESLDLGLLQASEVVVVGMAPELAEEMVIGGCIIQNGGVLNFKMSTE